MSTICYELDKESKTMLSIEHAKELVAKLKEKEI